MDKGMRKRGEKKMEDPVVSPYNYILGASPPPPDRPSCHGEQVEFFLALEVSIC